jgi:hypothetical protein
VGWEDKVLGDVDDHDVDRSFDIVAVMTI